MVTKNVFYGYFLPPIYIGSSKSVTISSYELFRSKYGLFYGFKHKPVSLGNEADFILFTILPHEAKKIHITEQYKFTLRGKEKLYVKFSCMGKKKPITKFVY